MSSWQMCQFCIVFYSRKRSVISNPLRYRYYAVCKPLTFANSYNRARILIIGSIVSGIVLSIPLLVFYGHKTVWFDIPGIPRGLLPGDDFFTPINTSAGSNYLNRTEEMTTQAMTAFMFLSSENGTFQNTNFTEDAELLNLEASGYPAKVPICHYSDEYDGSLSQVLRKIFISSHLIKKTYGNGSRCFVMLHFYFIT